MCLILTLMHYRTGRMKHYHTRKLISEGIIMHFLQMRMAFFFYFSVLCLLMLPFPSHSATVVVDGITNWKNPIVNIGDSIIFRHKLHYSLYIFRSRLAFNLCNFTQATCLTNPNSSSYTWHPSRLGSFYFSFNNGTDKPCQRGEKLSIKVIPETTTTNNIPPTPAISAESPQSPTSSPAYPWPFQPHEEETGGPSGAQVDTSTAPLVPGGKGASTVPFINSNPAVPLPTDQVDSATIGPLPTLASNHATRQVKVVGLLGFLIPPCISILQML